MIEYMMQCEFILFVRDQERSREFYRRLLQRNPVLDEPGMTEFDLLPNCKLGLLQRQNAARILGNDTLGINETNDIPRCELYMTVEDPEENLRMALEAGAGKLSDPELRSWGDVVAYCTDPDNHVIAFAKQRDTRDG